MRRWPGGAIVALLLCAGTAVPQAGQEAHRGLCADARARQLHAWQVVGQPRPVPGTQVRHWPTRQLGTWVADDGTAERPVLLLVTPTTLTRVEWTAGCDLQSHEWPRPAVASPRFTDADLAALVNAGRPGVVFVWSPHMPLSIDAYRPLRSAATARGMTVHAVLDPGADRAFARGSLDRGGLPNDALRVADANELRYRDVHLHTPVVLVFAGGRIIGDAWPGYHGEAEYGEFLDRALAERR